MRLRRRRRSDSIVVPHWFPPPSQLKGKPIVAVCVGGHWPGAELWPGIPVNVGIEFEVRPSGAENEGLPTEELETVMGFDAG